MLVPEFYLQILATRLVAAAPFYTYEFKMFWIILFTVKRGDFEALNWWVFSFFMQEVNDMWAGLGYYRRARFLLEVRYVQYIWNLYVPLYPLAFSCRRISRLACESQFLIVFVFVFCICFLFLSCFHLIYMSAIGDPWYPWLLFGFMAVKTSFVFISIVS